MIFNKKSISNTSIYIFLSLVTLLLYYKTFSYPFIDLDHVVNPFLQKGLTWESIKWAFTNIGNDYWKPLTYTSELIDNTLLLSLIGDFYFKRDSTKKALRYYEKSILIDPFQFAMQK